jgi:hypothetical protein
MISIFEIFNSSSVVLKVCWKVIQKLFVVNHIVAAGQFKGLMIKKSLARSERHTDKEHQTQISTFAYNSIITRCALHYPTSASVAWTGPRDPISGVAPGLRGSKWMK